MNNYWVVPYKIHLLCGFEIKHVCLCRAKFNIEPNGGKYSKFFFSGTTELFESKLCPNVLWWPSWDLFLCLAISDFRCRWDISKFLLINICIRLWPHWQTFQNIYAYNYDVHMLDFKFNHVPMSLRKTK